MLTSEELYRSETYRIRRLTHKEEQDLIARARMGDTDARTALLHSCLNYIGCIAARHARFVFHDEYLDLVGIGNVAIVERFEEALQKENPCGFLRGCAKYSIIYYCFNKSALVPAPWKARQRIKTTSLNTPMRENTVQKESGEVREPPDYSFLYDAIEKLPKHYQDVLICHYGLYNRPDESLYMLSKKLSQSEKGSVAYLTAYRAIKRLRNMLS